MTREDAIATVEDMLADIQVRAAGAMDWKGEPDLRDAAESIFDIARQAEAGQP